LNRTALPSTPSITVMHLHRRTLEIAALGVVLGLLAAVQFMYFERGIIPGDAFTYLAAGERLNAGHLLYAISPGDRPLNPNPPLWTVPLLSPPPIAVLFRAFAVLPNGSGAYAWWACQLAALGASLLMLARRVPLILAGAMLVLLIPTVYEIGVGNLNSMLLLGLILTWRFATRGPEPAAGAIAAVLAGVKLTPGMLVWWLLVTGHRRAFIAAVVTGLVVLGVSVAGAGLDAHLQYLRILGDRGAVGTSPLSLAGMARFVGIPASIADPLPTVAALTGLVVVAVLRHRPAAAFCVAVITMIYGSPAVSINWYILLYALLAPVAWPLKPIPATAQAEAEADRRVVEGDEVALPDR
jgi:hypothetical protein